MVVRCLFGDSGCAQWRGGRSAFRIASTALRHIAWQEHWRHKSIASSCLMMPNVQEQLEALCTELRRRQIEGPLPCAKRTAEILRLLVTSQRHPDANALIEDVRAAGFKLQEAKPVELAVGNMVRRVLHIIREEAQQEEVEEHMSSFSAGKVEAFKAQPGLLSKALRSPASLSRLVFPRAVSLSNLLDVSIGDIDKMVGGNEVEHSQQSGLGLNDGAESDLLSNSGKRRGFKIPQWKNKHSVIENLNELIEELDNIQNAIILQGVEHIHANEVILTFGMSDTTHKFLKEASKKREFQVVVAEAAPRFDGHLMARKLADSGIQTTVIADAAVFAMMARANKVLVGAHAVLANGGVVAPSGIHMVALAAKKHSIPFVVLVGLHKLSPLFPHDHDLTYNEFKSPADVVDFDVLAEAFAQREALNTQVQSATPPVSPSAALPGLGPQPQQAVGPSATSVGSSPAERVSPGAGAASGPASTSTRSMGGAGLSVPARSNQQQLQQHQQQQVHASVLWGSSPPTAQVQFGARGASTSSGGGAGVAGLAAGNYAGAATGVVHVPNPVFDYIPPHLVSLFVTDTGGYVPSYVYRLLTEYYSREDYNLRDPEPLGTASARSSAGSFSAFNA